MCDRSKKLVVKQFQQWTLKKDEVGGCSAMAPREDEVQKSEEPPTHPRLIETCMIEKMRMGKGRMKE